MLALLGRLGLRPLFRSVARTDSPELFMAACLLVVLATGLAAASAGLSMALGALIAGVLLAETEYRRQVEVTIEPFKGLLLGVFLISVGLRLDLARLAQSPLLVLGCVMGLVGLKAGITFGLARAFRVRGGAALQSALLLGPGGEFGFVIIGRGGQPRPSASRPWPLPVPRDRIVDGRDPHSLMGRSDARPAPGTPKPSPDLLPPNDPAHGGVIIAGFGRVGRTVAAMLDAHDIAWVALDSDIGRVSQARKAAPSVFYGDMTQPALLSSVGLDTARALVVTIDDRSRADTIVQIARTARPDLLIVVRARDAKHAAHLYRVGATDAVPETIEASLQLSEAVLVDLGVPMGPVMVSVHEQRARFQADIRRMAPDATIPSRTRKRLREAAPAVPMVAPAAPKVD